MNPDQVDTPEDNTQTNLIVSQKLIQRILHAYFRDGLHHGTNCNINNQPRQQAARQYRPKQQTQPNQSEAIRYHVHALTGMPWHHDISKTRTEKSSMRA